jgi:hypothetical protein
MNPSCGSQLFAVLPFVNLTSRSSTEAVSMETRQIKRRLDNAAKHVKRHVADWTDDSKAAPYQAMLKSMQF